MTPSTAKVLESSLPARLDKAQRDLAACRAQTERSATVTLVLGLTCLLDAWLLKQHKPTFDVTLPPPISGWIGGVAAIAAGLLIGTTIFN